MKMKMMFMALPFVLSTTLLYAESPTPGIARSRHNGKASYKVAQHVVAAQPKAPNEAITWWPVNQPPSFNEP
jgi:hypothetical protein